MPTMREHVAALRAATAAGDTEAVQYIRQQMVAEQQAADRAEYNPVAGMSRGEQLRAGIGRGMTNIARQIGNIAGVYSDEDLNAATAQDEALLNTGAGKVGNFIGETATVMLPTMGVAGLAGRTALLGNVARNAVGRGALEGAVQGAITAGPDNRMAGATMGAGAGAILPGVAAGYRAARSGVRPTANARRVMAAGAELTPGQMNPKGVLNQIEEVAQAVPVLGNIVKGARDKGYKQFQASVVQDVAPPGVRVALSDDMGRMMDDLYKAYDNAYDGAKGFPVRPVVMRTQGSDIPLLHKFRQAAAAPSTRATKEEATAIRRYLESELSRLRGGNVKSDDLLQIRSNIRRALREEGGSATAKGRILKQAEKDITEALDSQLPPPAMKVLRETDGQYGKFKILEDAVYRAKDQTDSFTPAQLSQAVRSATQKSEYAKGGGRLRGQAQAAVDVFQPRQPLTGRQVITAGPILAAAAANPVTIGAPAALTAAGLYGTKFGNALAAGRTPMQQTARMFERKVRRALPKEGRETVARYGRNALVNYLTD